MRNTEESKKRKMCNNRPRRHKDARLFLRGRGWCLSRGRERSDSADLFYSLDTKETFLRSAEGSVFVAKLTKRTILPVLTLRYGLVNNLELDIASSLSTAILN